MTQSPAIKRQHPLSFGGYLATICTGLGLLLWRFGQDYRMESNDGMLLGIASGVLVILAVVSARNAGSEPFTKTRYETLFRQLHGPVGLLALLIALVHWQPKFNDTVGIACLALMSLVVLLLAWLPWRRHRSLRQAHRYAGYLLLVLVLFHGVEAMFMSGN